MSMSRRLAAVATALGTVAAGLLSGATVGSADAASAGGAQTVEVFVKRDHTIRMLESISPGLTTFEITSARPAGFQIVQAAKGYTKSEAMRDIGLSFSKNNMKAFKRFEKNITLYGGMPSSPKKPATLRVDLDEGTYWALDTMPATLPPSKILTFEVTGDKAHGELSGQVIRAVGEVDWGKVSPRITPSGTILFENASADNHFLEIVRLAKGKTMKDFRAWIKAAKQGKQTRPPVVLTGSIDTGVISPGTSMSFDYKLRPGNYVLLCWWPDADMGGMPHAFMGMYRGLKVG